MILRDNQLHDALQRAFDEIEQDVCSTMGAAGSSVVVTNLDVAKDGIPFKFTKDGITVLRDIVSSGDGLVRKVAILMLSPLEKQWKEVGDGTTTATLLTCAFYKAICEQLKSGKNVHQVVREAKAFISDVITELEKQRRPADTAEKLIRIATISANNDEFLGRIIGKATYDVGKHGMIDVSVHDKSETEVEITSGYVINGVADRYMTDVHGNYFFESSETPKILLTLDIIDKNEEAAELIKLYNSIATAKGSHFPLIVVCADITSNVLYMIKANQELNIRQGVEPHQMFFIRHGVEGTQRTEYLQDLAFITGATVISKHEGKPIKSKTHKVEPKYLGELEWVKLSEKNSILRFPDKDLSSYILQLEKEIDSEIPDDRKEWLKKRAARLVGKVGFLRVGAKTKIERSYTDDLVDDAVRNTKAAFEDGYVLGGGLALRNVANFIFREHELVDVLRKVHAKVQTNAHGMCNEKDNKDYCNDVSYDLFTNKQISYEEAEIYDSFRGVKTALEVSMSLASEFVKTFKMDI